MNANFILTATARIIAGVTLSCSLVLGAYGAQTALSNEPFSSSSAVTAKPNIMFVLDDSGSMKQDYLPDWAGPYQQLISSVLTVITPAHRFYNNSFNGVAYNPATRYRPPVMYTSAGALDTTTYPSMTGSSTASGGDSSATSSLPNWRAVKIDGYGVQSTATISLEGQAFSYTTIPGEYCNSKQLRTCTASASATGAYTQPAYLRWCTTDAMANDTTTNAGTNCQASNIANTAANLTAGVTPYTYARMPKPRTSTITVNAAGTVTGITVDSQQILNTTATGGTSTDLATDIAAKINACTYAIPGSSACTVVGFSATTNSANVVVVTAPTITSSTPVISGGATSVTAFSGGNVPGGSLFTVITPSVTSYPFPGSATKGVNRIDCAGTTCTYAEEMTNYANWYAYYRTRMQMMKTGSSLAFSNVDDNFRVGYYTINNGSGSDFINLSAFNGGQKYQWYSKFFSAVPFGVTPLRTGLANAGKIYAGQISSLNSVAVTDPMQYSCQQNYTILSTDGYWNDSSNPTRLDGNPIGEQDGNDPRPYYDGATQTRTVTQTTRSDLQLGINTFLIESMTRQQQTSTSQLDQTVDTKDIYPWMTQTSTLQTRTTPLNKTDYSLIQSTYPLTSVTKELQESTYKLNSTPRILQSYLNRLTQTTTPLEAKTYNVTRATKLLNQSVYNVTRSSQLLTRKDYNVTRSTQLLTKKDYNVTRSTQLVTKKDYNVTRSTQLVTQKDYNVTRSTQLVTKKDYTVNWSTQLVTKKDYTVNWSTQLLTRKVYNDTVTSYALQSSTYKLQSSTRQLQQNKEISSDGGDTWVPTGWVDVSSCTVAASGPGFTRNTTCRYNTAVVVGGLGTCTNVAASVGPTSYTVAQAVTCAYETVPVVAAVGTCSVIAQPNLVSSHYEPSVSCGYSAVASVATGQTSCTARDQAGASTMTNDKVVCTYDTTPTTTTDLATCSWVVPATAASGPRTDCSYQTATSLTGQSTCSAAIAGTATTNGSVWNTARACAYDATPTTTTDLSTCSWVVPSPSASATRTDCSYQTATSLTGQTTCSAATASSTTTNGSVWNTARACAYDATPTTTTDLSTCTWVVPSPSASATRTDCSYQTASTQAGQTTCSAATAASATTNGSVWNTARTCAYDASPTTTTTDLSTCSWVVPATVASVPRTDCSYQTASTQAGQTTCSAATAASATTNGSVWNTARTCAYDASPTTTTTDLSTCSWVVPSPSASATRTDCSYQTASIQAGQTTCSAATAASAVTNGSVWNTARVCSYDATPASTLTDQASCSWVVPSPNASATRTDCSYQTATTLAGQATCSVTAAGTVTTDGTVWNTARGCAYDATPTTTTGLSSCTWVVPVTAATAPKADCSYETAIPLSNQATCTAAPAGTVTTNGTVWNTAMSCSYDTTPTVTTVASCTWVVPSPVASGPKTDCSYRAATTLAGQTSCAAAPEGTVTTNGTVWNTARVCSYDAAPTTTLSNQSSCTWVVPATVASVPRTDCVYNTAAVSTSTVDSCPALAKSTGVTDATVWAGPNVDCAYQLPVLSGTGLANCTAGTATAGVPKLTYTTCGYINGTTLTGQDSCSYIADSTANPYVPANACAYSTTPIVANVGSCTARAQSGTFAATQQTCAYETVGTPASNLPSCTSADQSSGAYPWTGPSRTCAYSGTAVLSYPTSCTVSVEAGPSYLKGSKVSCAYAGGVPSNNVASCPAQAKQTLTTDGAAYSPAVDCAWGTTTGWSTATAACVPVAMAGTSPNAGPNGPARDCQYTSWSAGTITATCAAAAQNNTNLTATNCIGGAYPVDISNVTTIVDSCSTLPTTNGASPVERKTTTTCVPRTAVVTDTATCTPSVAATPPSYNTTVTCPVTNSALSYVPTASCTFAGGLPATFDATGKIVDCRKTDQLGTTAPKTSGTVDSSTTTALTQALTATCTPGIDSGTQVQTKCTTLLSTGPDPVQSCTTVDPAVPPSYVKTTCVTTNPSSSVMGCTAQTATSPLWQTVTCTDNGDGTSNTLADVAAYYYKTDLRTPALGNCSGAIVSPATTANVLCSATDDMNNVRASATDPNTAQHMTTFTLGLGASGYMKYSDTYLTDTTGDFPTVKGVSPYTPSDGITANPTTGVCSWQPNGLCNWPFPTGDEQTTIDDLWHAAVNGHGAYYSARDPASLSAGISAALNGVAAAGGYASAPSLSSPNLALSDNYLFTSSYVSLDWTGELLRWRVDPYSGTVAGVSDWSAQAKLDAKLYTSRLIYTFDASVATTKLKAFTSTNFATNSYFNMPYISATSTGLSQFLCTSADICLTATDQDSSHASGGNLVNYLRGDRTNEGTEIDNTKYYRQRQHVLGDIVNAQSLYVFKPERDYTDPGYAAFKTAQATRQAAVYAAANDGMLHAFAAKGNATTEALVDAYALAYAAAKADPSNASLLTAANTAAAAANTAISSDPTTGQELWAYIPSMALPKLYKLADKKYRNMHRYLVDATPTVGDVCTSNCTDAANAVWKTILVGGLGHGGRGFYALDITDPANPKALWEFTNANLGYSYGNSQITKLSDGTWVVLLSSGYNNIPNDDGAGGDGVGRLFVLNAATGAQITGLSPISTGFGDTTTPSGLSNIATIVVNPQTDNTIIAAYGGDLYGNLWRFDVNDIVGPSGTEAQLLAVLKDGAGNTQPITTKPIVSVVREQKVIYVGTGRFLDSIDIADTSQQSIYAIKDPWTTGGVAATAIYNNPGDDRTATGRNTKGFVRQVYSWISCPATTSATICASGDQVMTSTNNSVNFTADNGWFADLINTAEKANTNPALGLGMLVYTTNAPSLLACDIGGKSYVYFLNYLTGGPIRSAGNSGGVIGYLLSNSFASAPTIVVRATPTGGISSPVILVSVAAAGSSGGSVVGGSGTGSTTTSVPSGVKSVGTPIPPEATITRRTSWRELISD